MGRYSKNLVQKAKEKNVAWSTFNALPVDEDSILNALV